MKAGEGLVLVMACVSSTMSTTVHWVVASGYMPLHEMPQRRMVFLTSAERRVHDSGPRSPLTHGAGWVCIPGVHSGSCAVPKGAIRVSRIIRHCGDPSQLARLNWLEKTILRFFPHVLAC
ncbi:hypothetical protein DFH06DRAFT_1173514, partial [Mycena polygramma]